MVFVGRRRKSWKTVPMFRLMFRSSPFESSPIERELKYTEPEVGATSAKSILRSVVFPAPEWPTMNTNSPDSMERVMSSTAC